MQFDLQQKFYGNTAEQYLYALGAIAVAWIILQVMKRWVLLFVRKLSGKTDNHYDDVFISALEKFVIPYIYLVINFNIIRQLNLPPRVDRILDVALTFITVLFAARLINHAIHLSLQLYMKKRQEAPARMKQLTGILLVIKVTVWALGLLFFLDNIGYDVTTVVAGLGVGGIAIALAAQNILGDLFSYFVIFFDKPFEVGDFIVVGQQSGTVEKVGIKTSHVRSISGEQLVMPNAELVKSTISNYKRMEKRRVVFKFGVVYETAIEHLEAIPSLVKEVIQQHEHATVDRSHLQGMGDFSINFETVYFIDNPDYALFMDIHQQVCLSVLRRFREMKIELAYPTQKIYTENPSTETNTGTESSIISDTNISPVKNTDN